MDSFKLSQLRIEQKSKSSNPLKLKTIPRSRFVTPSSKQRVQQTGMLHQIQTIFQNDPNAFDEYSFKNKYQRALQIINRGKENEQKGALAILQNLSDEILKLPENNRLNHELLEGIVINCWKIKNSFQNRQIKSQDSLSFIKKFVVFFTEHYKKKLIHKSGLHMLYLIVANEQYEQKLYSDALKSCDLSIKHCSQVKKQHHLLKVQYLKCNIFNGMGNHREQLQSIKRSLLFINSLIATTNEQALKDYIFQLRKTLMAREIRIRQQPKKQKSIEIQKKISFSQFRRRSLSLKKIQSKKQITQKKPEASQVKQSKLLVSTSNHIKSAGHSKQNSVAQQRVTFLPVDLTKFAKQQKKLKKAPMVMSRRLRIGEQTRDYQQVMRQIEQVQPYKPNFLQLVLRRPNQKREMVKKASKQAEKSQIQGIDKQIQQFIKKQSQKQDDRIQPVTHYILKSMQTQNDDGEQQIQQLVKQCVKMSQQSLFKNFVKKLMIQDQTHNLLLNNIINNHYHQNQNGQTSSSDESSSIQYQNKNATDDHHYNSHQNNHHNDQYNFDYYEPQLSYHNNLDDFDGIQLIFYGGVLSSIKFGIKIQKKQEENQSGQLYKELYLSFNAYWNYEISIYTTLTFRFYNPYESNIDIIIDQICRNQIEYQYSEQECLKIKLLRLLANKLLIKKKANGISIIQKVPQLQKQYNSSLSYITYLRNRFIIYQQNALSKFAKHPLSTKLEQYQILKSKQRQFPRTAQPQVQQKQQSIGYHQILTFYLPKLIQRMTSDLKQDKSSLSSLKRMKTQKFYKDTILSYKSLIRSQNQSDLNGKFMYDDLKSLSIVMPSDFNQKISNFFSPQQEIKQTSIYQFYYCMKFILIQPSKNWKTDMILYQMTNKRRRTIDKMLDSCQQDDKTSKQQDLIKSPRFLENTLDNFYDQMVIDHIFHLKNKVKTHIKMTCYKVKEVFKKTEEYFYKFQMQFTGQKIKMMKFITTSHDIYLLICNKGLSLKDKQKNLKSSRKIKYRLSEEEDQLPPFNRESLLNLLKAISQKIFVKKDYIYSIVGLQIPHSHFNFINKFKLQGKTVQNKQFMIPHLKYIHVLLQKSIKITCEHLKQFAVLSILHIQKSIQFNIIFYLPKYQKTYSINLNKNIINYLQEDDYEILGRSINQKSDIQKILFRNNEEYSLKQEQTQLWNNFTKLFRFQLSYYEDRKYLLLKIGDFSAFLKDICFSEYFELKGKILHLQISLNKKSIQNSSEFDVKNIRISHPKRKSSSSKQLIKRSQYLLNKQMKSSGRVINPSIMKQCFEENQIFKKGEIFQRLSKIYQTETSKYIVYISLTNVYQISKEKTENQEESQTKKVNLSFYLSDLLTILRDSKKELYMRDQLFLNEFNEEFFSFSILLRAMTIIKYKIINQLKQFTQMDQIFEGQNLIQMQKLFKNSLIIAFNSQNQNLYSLNSSKKLYKLENNIYLINKSLMNSKKNAIVSIFFDEKAEKITFYITNSNDFINRQKIYYVKDMKFSWMQLYSKQHLFKVSNRIYKYYKNILLFS